MPWVPPAPSSVPLTLPRVCPGGSAGTPRVPSEDPRVGQGCARPEILQARDEQEIHARGSCQGRILLSQTTMVCASPLPQSSMFRKLPWYRRVNVGTEDNATNTHLQSQQCHTATETAVRERHPLPVVLGHNLISRGNFQAWTTQGDGERSLWDQDGKICSLQSSVRVLGGFNADAEQTQLCLSHPRACCHPRARKHKYPGGGW